MDTPLMVRPSIATATRYHDFSAGHRVVGHENKCAFLHGHNYRVHFTCQSAHLDDLGRVIDFGVIKSTLCEWLESNWDHKFIAWEEDPLMSSLHAARSDDHNMLVNSIYWVTFNPTAENMALHLLHKIAPLVLAGTGVICTRVQVDETRKCGAVAEFCEVPHAR
jgi:6-pyruvoyltetrahydropterin/6-carboxytetrahydropterin synthase